MEDKLINICDRFIEFFGWDYDSDQQNWNDTGSRSASREDKLKYKVYKAKIESSKYGLGITSLYNSIAPGNSTYSTCFSDFVAATHPSNFTEERVHYLITYIYIIKDLVNLYNSWNANEFSQSISSLGNHELFSETDIEMDPRVIEAIDDIVNKERFKTYLYRDGGDKINKEDKYYISTEIGFSQDITSYLKHLKSQKQFLQKQKSDQIFVSLFGKLDTTHWIYSNWIITLHKGDTIWLITDQINFDNPSQKDMRLQRRSAWRDTEHKFNEIDLPYELFENQSSLRAATTSLVNQSTYKVKDRDYEKDARDTFDVISKYSQNPKTLETEIKRMFDRDMKSMGFNDCRYEVNSTLGSFYKLHTIKAIQNGKVRGFFIAEKKKVIFYENDEVLFQKTKELKLGHRIFLVALIARLIEQISITESFEKIELAADFIQRKLIEGAEFEVNEGSLMTHWNLPAQKIFGELIESLEHEFGESKALKLQSYLPVLSSTRYDRNWLSTPLNQESLAQWLVLDNQVVDIRNKQRFIARKRSSLDPSHLELLKVIHAREKYVYDRVYEANTVEVLAKTYYFGHNWKSDTEEDYWRVLLIEDLDQGGSVDERRGKGIGKYDEFEYHQTYQERNCTCCGNSTAKMVKKATVYHYKGLMFLLGLENRLDLPIYYQNYRARVFIPYTGNSTLNQTHPYLKVIESDPCSMRSGEGIELMIYLCGHCHNRYSKSLEKSKQIQM